MTGKKFDSRIGCNGESIAGIPQFAKVIHSVKM
jgi:hypothetical protein